VCEVWFWGAELILSEEGSGKRGSGQELGALMGRGKLKKKKKVF